MSAWRTGLAASLALAIAGCTEQLAVGPQGQFSWEPQAQMIWPIEGAIVSAYGDSARANHQGIDLAARPKAPVSAALGGTVAFVGELRGYGDVVVLSHGERLTTVYAHLAEARVRKGETVAIGQTIGGIGSEGYLHYEIREAKRAVDPAKFYAVAPRPIVGGAVDVSDKLGKEPTGVGAIPPSGEVAEALPPPPPTPTLTPTLTPTPTPAPLRAAPTKPTPRVRSTPIPRRTPTAEPTRILRQTPTPSPTPRLTAAYPESEAAGPAPAGSDVWSTIGLGASLIGCNLLYVPAKLAYAGAGAVIGGFTLALSRDFSAANDVWRRTLGGDYLVTAMHLRGEQPLHFMEAERETPAPLPRP